MTRLSYLPPSPRKNSDLFNRINLEPCILLNLKGKCLERSAPRGLRSRLWLRQAPVAATTQGFASQIIGLTQQAISKQAAVQRFGDTTQSYSSSPVQNSHVLQSQRPALLSQYQDSDEVDHWAYPFPKQSRR